MLFTSIRDIADRKLVEARLERQALTDPLTGIANRTVLMDRLTQALRRLQRDRLVLAVIYLDLDRFKVINDSLGHKLGDQLLMKVAERALTSLRPADTLARIGGDEFVVVAEGLPDAGAAERWPSGSAPASRSRSTSTARPSCAPSAPASPPPSIPAISGQGLIQEADLALYRAKDRGRNRAEVFDEELRATAIGRLGTEQMVRHAIEHDGLRVHYQPIIDLRTGQVVEAEALVRIQWHDQLIMPDRFIDVAEDSGLLVDIDEWVLRRAVEQAAAWQRDLGPGQLPGIAINITGRHLSDSHFAQRAGRLPGRTPSADRLDQHRGDRAGPDGSVQLGHGRPAGHPGRSASRSASTTSGPATRLWPICASSPSTSSRSTSRSSGSWASRPRSSAIVTAIIDLAHALHLSVVAEGVETEDQLLILKRLGCDQGQGFLFSRPADPAPSPPSSVSEPRSHRHSRLWIVDPAAAGPVGP